MPDTCAQVTDKIIYFLRHLGDVKPFPNQLQILATPRCPMFMCNLLYTASLYLQGKMIWWYSLLFLHSKSLSLIDSFYCSLNDRWTSGGSFFFSAGVKTEFYLTMFFTRTIQCSDWCPFFKSSILKQFVGVVWLSWIFCCSSTITVFR